MWPGTKDLERKFDQTKTVLEMIASLGLTNEHRVLDVGCGYGKTLNLLRTNGLKGVGVDVNQSMVKTNLSNGLNCLTLEQFDDTSDSYDLIMMLHVIEHFSPPDLLHFIDHYLGRLKLGGRLILATPLMWPGFFDDFDHVKTYQPNAIWLMFAQDSPQTQYCSEYLLEPIEIRIRRRPVLLSRGQGLYLQQNWPKLEKFLGTFFSGLFGLSGGLVGMTTGWIGLYRTKGLRNK
jgi:SAM-dependent methyltransferase